jgi:hypothetical protein
MDETIEKAYTTKEISLTLDIGSSTLRKWCLALEENGYLFSRTDNQRRLFVNRDLIALRYFQKLVQGENFSLDNAAKVIASKYKTEASESRTPSVLLENEEEQRYFKRYDEDMEELKERVNNQTDVINKQTALIKDLVTRMNQQQKYIDNQLTKQDEKLTKRDELLFEALRESQRESQETKQLLLTAQAVTQEVKQVEEKKPRKGIMKWFSKD